MIGSSGKRGMFRAGGMFCIVSLIGAAWWHSSSPAWQTNPPGLRNPIDQREQMIKELQEIKSLLKEQNALLRARDKP